MSRATAEVIAIALAAAGAVLFGLAAVRQHGAVRDMVPDDRRRGLRGALSGALGLLRQPQWLVGAAQASAGGALHVVALALAPITLVQPIGVLAVPVTLTASAIKHRRRPGRAQLVGTALSILGIAALTVVLLLPPTNEAVLPSALTLGVVVGGLLVLGGGVALVAARAGQTARCLLRAVVAATLFGLNSILIRVLGEIVAGSATTDAAGLVVVAVLGIALALSLGVWSMQAAYAAGSPQVVICCLTLVDPLAAVVGGRLLLHDGAALSGVSVLLAVGCAVLATVGVVLLARVYPPDAVPEPLAPVETPVVEHQR